MTPYEISIFMHIYTRGSNFSVADIDTETTLFKDTIDVWIDDLVCHDLLGLNNNHGFALTTKGQIYIQLLLDVKPPESAYIDTHGNILEIDNES